MIFKENAIEKMTQEDRQLLYDALVNYMYAEAKIGRSNHFAADIHQQIAEQASKVAVGMREFWGDIVH